MKRTSNIFVRSLMSASLTLGGVSLAMAQAVTVDGTLDNLYGFPRVWQTVQTQFGDNTDPSTTTSNGSELTAGYSYIGGGNLNLFLSGNLQNGGNKIFVFLDTNSSTGQNRLRGDNTGIPALLRLGDSGGPNGLIFESGFTADHAFVFNADGTSCFVDYSPLPTSSGGTATYLGASALAAGSGGLGGGTNFLFAQAVLRNGNVAGVGGGNASGQIPTMPTTGLELSIPLGSLGTVDQSVKVFAFIANTNGDFLSNQFLPDVGANGATVGNFGEPRGVNLSAAGNPGTQFFYVQPRTKQQLWVSRIGNGATLASPATQVALMRLNPTGAGQTLAPVVSFNSNATSPRLTLRGTSPLEGNIKRSVDGRGIVIAGFDLEAGTGTPTASANSRTVVSVDGTLQTTYRVISTGGDAPRTPSALDLNNVFLPTDGGSYYVQMPAGTLANRVAGNFRSNVIANNRFYGVRNNAVTLAPVLPLSGVATATAIFGVGGGDLQDAALPDSRTIFAIEGSSTPVIRKFIFNGTIWTTAYNVTSTTLGSQPRGILARQTPSGGTNLTIACSDGSVRSFDDNGTATPTVQILAAGVSNYLVPGVDWSPEIWATPTANNDTGTTDEDTTLAVNAASGVLANDTGELKQNAVLVSNVAPAAGSVTLNLDGSYTFTPAADFSGAASFTYRFDDGDTNSNTATVNLTVNAQNDAPTLAAIPNQAVDELQTLNFTASGSDIDGPALTYSLAAGVDPVPAGASIDPNSGLFTWTPTEAQGAGVYSFNVVVSDGSLSDTKPVQVTVAEVNQNPGIAAVTNQTVQEGSLLTFNLSGTDDDLPTNSPAATLTYSLTGEPVGMTVDGNTGVVTWTPTLAQGPQVYNFTAVVTDGLGGSDSEAVQVTVTENAPPVLTWPGNKMVETGTELAIDINATDPDLPNDVLTFSLENAPAGATINPATGEFAWTPAKDGSYIIQVKVTDSEGLSDKELFSVTAGSLGSTVRAWGANFEGQLGDGTVINRSLPTTLTGLTSVIAINSGVRHSLALLSDGSVRTWGRNSEGQLGDGTTTTRLVPTPIPGLSNVVALSSGQTHSLALLEDGTVRAWGFNANGQLGDGTTTDRLMPTSVTGLTNVVSIAAGYSHSLALLSDGTVVGWGSNNYGQIGDGTGISRLVPTAAGGLTDVTAVAVGGYHTLALRSNGTVSAWGYGYDGQIGNGTNGLYNFVPTPVSGLTNVMSISAGFHHCLALQAAGVVQAWGWNGAGQLGDGTVVSRNVPTQVQALANVNRIAGGGRHSLAVLSDGTSRAWGLNDYGQIGDGTVANRLVPASISGLLNAAAIDGGDSFSLAIVGPATLELTQIVDQTVNELATLALNVSATGGTAPLTYSLDATSLGKGMVINSGTGVFSWTPSEAQDGSHTVTVTVTDADDETVDDTFTITVNEVNQNPTLAVVPNQTVQEGSLLTFNLSGTDNDLPSNSPAATLTYSLTGEPVGMSVDGSTGVVTWTPTLAQGPQVYNFTAVVTDGLGGSNSKPVQVTVTEPNAAPVLAPIGDKETSVGLTLFHDANATDPNTPAQALTFSLGVGAPVGMTIDPVTGIIVWDPAATGTYPVTVIVTDSGSPTLSDSELITITVTPLAVPFYDLTDLGTLGGPNSYAQDVNDAGQVVGGADISPGVYRAYRWTSGVMSNLGTLGGSNSYARGINEAGVAVGFARIPSNQARAFRYVSSMVDLGTLGGSNSDAYEINDAGVITGHSQIPSEQYRAFRVGSSMTDLGTMLGSNSFGYSINSSGVVVGESRNNVELLRAYREIGTGDMLPLGTLGGSTSAANDINDAGRIVGRSVNALGVELAFLFNTSMQSLGTLGGATSSASGLNNSGFVVGASKNSGGLDRGFLHVGGTMYDLNQRLLASGAGYTITSAAAISNNGKIAATATAPNGSTRAVLLEPSYVQPPVANDDTYPATEDTPLVVNSAAGVIANDTDDQPISGLSASVVTAPIPAQGSLTLNPNGSFTFTPAANFNGAATFIYKVNDGSLDSNTATVTINVGAENDAPTLAAISNQSVDELQTLNFTAVGNDIDGPSLTYTLSGAPAGASIDPNSGVFSWTPTEAQGPGVFNFSVVVSDGSLIDSKPVQVTVAEVNLVPNVAPIPNQSTDELVPFTYQVSASDNDLPAQTLTYSLVGAPAGCTIDSAGLISWTPTEAQGPQVYNFTVSVSDGVTATTTGIQIQVVEANVVPTANAQTVSVVEDTATNVTLTGSDDDLPAQTLTYTVVDGPTFGSLSGTGANRIYTPQLNFSGTDSFTFKVNDGTADSSVATVTLNVSNVNDMQVSVVGSSAPNAFGSPSWTGYRSNALTSLETTFGNDLGSRLVDPTAYDVVTTIPWYDNTATGWAFWMGNLNPVVPFDQELGHRLHFGVRVLGNGTRFSLSELTFDMNSSDPSNDMDFDGSFDGNDPSYPFPDFYGPSRRGIDYGPDRLKGTTDDIVYNTDATPAETEVDELIYVGIGNAWDATQEPGLTPAEKTESMRCYLEGLLAVAPIDISTTYAIRDGGYNGPVLASATGTVTMVPSNVLPTANSQSVNVAEDTATPITLSATDPDDATLTYTVIDGPSHGVLSGTGASRIYTPNANYSGPDSFTFKATDCVGDSNIATVTINVTPVNDDPILGAIGDRTIDEMVPYSITLGSADIDGGVPVYSVTSGLPSGASVTGNTFNWTPSETQGPGSYPITFQVSDGAGGLDSETITITVNEVNVAPTIDPISDQTVDEMTLVTFDADGADSDLPANTLTYSLIGAPSGATIDSSGEFSWTPTEAQGPNVYTFTVRVSDGDLHADESVTLTVQEVNLAPTLNAIPNQTVAELTALTFTAEGADSDDPSQTLVYSLVGAPTGAAIDGGTGVFTWTPTEAQGPQVYNFSVRVTDGVTNTDTPVQVTVTEANVAPVALAQTLGTGVNTPLEITLVATDNDLPANTLTYSIVDHPTNGMLSGSGDSWTYTPNLNYQGSDSFSFKANDGLVDSNVATVNINVSGITVTLDLQLQGFLAAGPTTRGITMFLGGTAGGSNPPVEVTRDVVFTSTGFAQIVFTPADGFDPGADLSQYAISIKDNLHTLRKTVPLTWDGSNYVASATLIGGNINRDNRIDIGDYVVYATRFGTTYPGGADTPMSLQADLGYRNADISGNGSVGTEEFSFISINFGQSDNNPVGNYGRSDITIRQRISVADAMIEAGRDAARLDRNRDGWISLEEATQRLR